MKTTRAPSLLALFLWACGAPSASPVEPLAPAPPPPAEVDEVDVPPLAATEPSEPEEGEAVDAPRAEAPRVLELDMPEGAEGTLVEAGTAARLASLGGGLRGYAGRIAGKMRRSIARQSRGRMRRRAGSAPTKSAPMPAMSSRAAAAAPARPARPAAEPPADEESVTNTQVAGVDEGGIVKAWREFLIVLRRGRLFTVRLGDAPDEVAAVAAIDVRPPGSQHDAWYDEMLVHSASGTIVVVGFSYFGDEQEATEIGLFRVAPDGALSRRQTHLLRSNDYYSSRNYASRLVDDTLVFYMPHYLVSMGYDERRDMETVSVSMPSTRRFRGGSWRSIVRSSEVYRIGRERNAATLHTVVTCDLAAPRFSCQARGIIGGAGRTFFVSRDAVYVWVSPDYPEWDMTDAEYDRYPDPSEQPSHLFRLPLDGSRPSALVVRGQPIDQFSFNETDTDLWVLVRASGSGDAMWSPEVSSGDLGLVRVPLSAFGPTVRTLARAAYRDLPAPGREGRSGSLQNRFIGDYVLYGQGTSWGRRAPGTQMSDRVFLHQYRAGRSFAVDIAGGVDRIEAMGGDAVVVGTDGRSLHFRAFELGVLPRAAGHYEREGAAQGETRSHGFFYRPTGEREGVLGLPTRSAGQPGAAQLRHGSAEVLYLAVSQLQFSELGALASSAERWNDRCEVSCVDWYGNARPLFYRGRVFALLGYELVEGRIAGGSIAEVGRSNLLTAVPRAARRPDAPPAPQPGPAPNPLDPFEL